MWKNVGDMQKAQKKEMGIGSRRGEGYKDDDDRIVKVIAGLDNSISGQSG